MKESLLLVYFELGMFVFVKYLSNTEVGKGYFGGKNLKRF